MQHFEYAFSIQKVRDQQRPQLTVMKTVQMIQKHQVPSCYFSTLFKAVVMNWKSVTSPSCMFYFCYLISELSQTSRDLY